MKKCRFSHTWRWFRNDPTKEERNNPACYLPGALIIWRVHVYLRNLASCTFGNFNAERHVLVLEQHILPFNDFSSEGFAYYKDLHTGYRIQDLHITKAWLWSRRVQVLNWPAYSLCLSQVENIWCIMKQKNTTKIQQRRPSTVEQLKSYDK